MKKDDAPAEERWAEELDLLIAIVRQTPLVETVKWGAPVFTHKGKNVVGIAGFKNFFTLWFYNGVFLSDPQRKLVNANEGVTKSLRQWRFFDRSEIDEKQILAYVNEAIEVEDKGLSIKPEKKKFDVPAILQHVFDSDPSFKTAFDAFTPGRQNEFLEYIGSAKQEKTQVSRLEKIRPMVLEGIGLNDNYRK